MTYVSTQHFASARPDTHSVDRAQNTIAKFIYSMGYWVQNVSRRRHLKTLDQLSDQQLLDIGLYRDDILEAGKLGYHKDVTNHLAEIARRRRHTLVRTCLGEVR